MKVCVECKLTCFCLCWSFCFVLCLVEYLIRSVDLVHDTVEGRLMLVTAQYLLCCFKFNLRYDSIFDSLLWKGDLYDIRVAAILLIFCHSSCSFLRTYILPVALHVTTFINCLKLVFSGRHRIIFSQTLWRASPVTWAECQPCLILWQSIHCLYGTCC